MSQASLPPTPTPSTGGISIPAPLLHGLIALAVGAGGGMGAATYQDESVITRIEAIEERIEDQRVRLSEHGTTVGHADNTRRVDALEDRMDRAEDERRELARTIESIDRKLYTVCMATTGGNESACRTIR